MSQKITICTTGLPGSGKGIFIRAAEKIGLPTYIMGDYVRREASKLFGRADSETTGKTMLMLREKFGKDIIAKLVSGDVERDGHKYFLIDGVRSMDELEYFRNMGWKTILVCVLASRKTRLKRLVIRNRIDDIKDIFGFLKREEREGGVGLYELLWAADYYFYNEDLDEAEAIIRAEELLRHILLTVGVKNWEEKEV